MASESLYLDSAVAVYLLAMLLAMGLSATGGRSYQTPMLLIAVGLALHTAAIALRWQRLDHAPYVDLFEILSSNVWSLHLATLLLLAALPGLRPALATILPLLFVLVAWMWIAPVKDTQSPVTYATFWLPVHVTLGKFFLGLVVTAVGLGLVILGRRLLGMRFSALADDAALDAVIYRLMLIAVMFQSMMLIAGAAWAQDAWGRYWAWDPLETWAFVTWTGTLFYLHWRPKAPGAHVLGALLVVAVFMLAFSTFFGVPFLSTSPHKGAI